MFSRMRSIEQERILQHHAQLRAKSIQIHVGQVNTINQHRLRLTEYETRRAG